MNQNMAQNMFKLDAHTLTSYKLPKNSKLTNRKHMSTINYRHTGQRKLMIVLQKARPSYCFGITINLGILCQHAMQG